MRMVREPSEIDAGDNILYGSYGESLVIDYARYKYSHGGYQTLYVGEYCVEDLIEQFIVIKV